MDYTNLLVGILVGIVACVVELWILNYKVEKLINK